MGYYEVNDNKNKGLLQHISTASNTDQDAVYTINEITITESKYVLNYSNSTEFNTGSTENGSISNGSVELAAGESYQTEGFTKEYQTKS